MLISDKLKSKKIMSAGSPKASSPQSKKTKIDEAAASPPAAKLGGTGRSDKRMVGYDNFVRHNPKSDKFEMLDFDHLDVWCSDATNTAGRFAAGLGMAARAKSDITTGNFTYTSHVIQSNDMVFVFTAPYFTEAPPPNKPMFNFLSFPDLNRQAVLDFVAQHGIAVRAIGLLVTDATVAYEEAIKSGATSVQRPTLLTDKEDSSSTLAYAEIQYYGDVVLRLVERKHYKAVGSAFMPGFQRVDGGDANYGIRRFDHVVSNVPSLMAVMDAAVKHTGVHEFAEFIASDVGTVDSGLNSVVLANNTETILLPINEPTFGTKRKSQIQSFLEHHKGPGVQHIALSTPDIFATIEKMRGLGPLLGFEFLPAPEGDYYEKHVPEKMKGMHNCDDAFIARCKKLNILIDRDDEGGLLQIFTKPVLDRPTLFFEVIQRLGCPLGGGKQKPGCGGFGKGNFGALFKTIEQWEKKISD